MFRGCVQDWAQLVTYALRYRQRLLNLNNQLFIFPMANYGINGFGRIGRNVLRAMDQSDVKRIVAINDLTDTHTLAHLLKWDSVHGKFDGEISYDPENIIVRGHKIKVLKERDPGNLPWKSMGAEVILESKIGRAHV